MGADSQLHFFLGGIHVDSVFLLTAGWMSGR